MDKQKYTRKIATKRKGNYISTKDILDIIEEAIKEYSENKIQIVSPVNTNAISGQDLRGVR